MIDGQLTIRRGRATRTLALADYLDAAGEEKAHDAEYAWIKSLRQLPVDGTAFRDRFAVDGDSLWWFTELYLHKQRTILNVHRAMFALQNLLDGENPSQVDALDGSPAVAFVSSAIAAARRIAAPPPPRPVTWLKRLATLDARARALTLSALTTRDRWRRASDANAATLAVFVHRAFWRAGQDDGAAETYVGPVLAALERQTGSGGIRYVGVGPARNFRAHRPLRFESSGSTAVVPVERFASAAALARSRGVWRQRYGHFRTLTGAQSLKEAARIDGIDIWPVLREELAGIAWLQWPWSVRSMDEAAAALDALHPKAVMTYAEAGGWGRALVLEARRRHIPSAGIQHGFIYRHWLNYRHEPDEMEPSVTGPFPRPTRTLVFDDYAARHLLTSGRFPPESVRVTGSPKLDQLAAEIAALSSEALLAVRQQVGASGTAHVILVATKEREARNSLPAFLDAVGAGEDRRVVIKPHPAESADTYLGYLQGRANVQIAPADLSLGRLLAIARLVVTVNSTVALDAGALGVAAMTVGLPNNLSPFVDAGAIAGAHDPAELTRLLDRILYDERLRQQLRTAREATFGAREKRPEDAAARAADAVLQLVRQGCVAAGQKG